MVNERVRAGIAGAAGAVVAFGLAELVHGIYNLVPSIFVSLAQGIIELTPGGFATRAIETLGQADIPTLVTSTIVGALVVAALLSILSLKRPLVAAACVALLAVVGLVAAFSEPFVAQSATVITVVGALVMGSAVTVFLQNISGLRAEDPAVPPDEAATPTSSEPAMEGVRVREAHSSGGISVGRGQFVALSGAAALVGLTAAGTGRVLSGGGSAESDEPKALDLAGSSNESTDESTSGGKKSVTHEKLPAVPKDVSIDAPGMVPIVTPAKDFYLIDTALSSPRIDVDSWSLKVKGSGVRNPLELTYKDLQSMSTREADVTLSCVSNEVGGGLISNGRWTGVMLSDVLKEAGVDPSKINKSSEQLVGRSADDWTGGFKTKLAFDGREALVAFGLNDSELPQKHGFPVRLVVPGIYGYVSATKWLTEIELTNWDFDAYWIQRTWTKEGPIKTQSRIDTIKGDDNLSAGKIGIGGVAWAPHRGIDRVEVSTDDGDTWNEARLAAQLDKDTWRHYMYDWDAKPGDYTVKVRATDGEGDTQTSKTTKPHPNGASGHHTIKVSVA